MLIQYQKKENTTAGHPFLGQQHRTASLPQAIETLKKLKRTWHEEFSSTFLPILL